MGMAVQPADFFDALWNDFVQIAPQAAAIRLRLEQTGERVENDHVAFRSFARAPIRISDLEPHFLAMGYAALDDYVFSDKHLRARAYVQAGQPRIFLSELIVEKLSPWAQGVIEASLAHIDATRATRPDVFWAGRLWPPIAFSDYERLAEESEYAGWLLALGMHANHFTVSVNALSRIDSIHGILDFVESAGYPLNVSGGRVKGSAEVLLEQGSTLADRAQVEFAGGEQHTIPTCYYEFALRYPDASGRLYEGFVPASADRIFESTDRNPQA